MKFFQSKLTLSILFSLTFLSNNTFATNASDAEIQKAQQIMVDSELNNRMNIAIEQLKRIEYALQYIMQLIYNEGKKFKNKEEILQYTSDIRSTINSIKSSSFLVPEPGTIAIVQKINDELCESLKNAISYNIWNPIKLGEIVKRSEGESIGMNDIIQLQMKNQNDLQQLETTIERFGLTYTQKAIRNLEDGYNKVKFYIENKKLKPYLKWSAYGAAIATYVIYQSEALAKYMPLNNSMVSNVWNNRFTRKVKGWIGSAPRYIKDEPNQKYNHIINETSKEGIIRNEYDYKIEKGCNLGILGTIDKHINQNAGTELSYKTLIPGVTAGWMTNKILGDLSLYATIMPIMIKQNKAVNMATVSNILFYIQNSEKYLDFKAEAKHYFNKKYEKLRGKSSKSSLDKKPILTFKDVIGLEYPKGEFETVIDYIINPDKFERTKLTPAKGYLMVGPPRTGKSHIARAICGEINERQKLLGKPKSTNFIPLDADLISDKSFYKVMEYINSKAPCVVFIDEIDLLALNRGDGNKENKLLSQILTHMSGYISTPSSDGEESGNNKQVIFIAATNNPHSLDGALTESGRFGKIINFEYPHLADRTKFIKHELKKRCITTLSNDFVEGVAKELEGYTFEDIFLVITSAIQKASSEYTAVGEHHFRTAIEETIKKIMPLSKPLSDSELETISVYQSGKALATKLLTPSVNISTLTTMPINTKIETKKDSQIITTPLIQYGGIFTYKNTDLLNLSSNNELKLKCKILLAGHVAQELLIGNSYYTYRAEDQQEASLIAKQIALKGEKYENLTEDLQKNILQEAYKIKQECKAEIKELLSEKIETLNKLNNELKNKKHLGEIAINKLLS